MLTNVALSAFELRTPDLTLRDFVPEDEAAFVEWAAHREMYQYMAWRLGSAAEATAEFHRLLGHPERTSARRSHWYLAVVESHGRFGGMAGFDQRRDGLGEFGWYLAPAFWGRGYATAITALFLRFGFEALEVPAITATCDPDNVASRRVLEKSGLLPFGEETVATSRGDRPRLRFIITSNEWRRLCV